MTLIEERIVIVIATDSVAASKAGDAEAQGYVVDVSRQSRAPKLTYLGVTDLVPIAPPGENGEVFFAVIVAGPDMTDAEILQLFGERLV